tara:strand:+ start:88 stop:456 length:369 start_codon:yes stop_codon:yes gene_type:complete
MPSILEQYGISDLMGEPDMFTKVSEGLRKTATSEPYRPFFQLQQQGAEGSFLANMNKVGQSGFAGSGGGNSMMDMLYGQFGQQSAEFANKMFAQAQQGQARIDDITRANKSTALQLKQLEKA